jgi:hypothetical protein
MIHGPTRRALIGGMAGLAALPAPARALEPGSHRLEIAEPAGATAEAMAVFFHMPAAWRPDGRVVVVMHGVNRTAELYRDQWRDLAEAGRFLLLVPEFSRSKFPGTRWYNFGNVQDDLGQPVPRAAWSFYALDRAVQAAMRAAGATRPGFSIYGHSAGAQFLLRYLMLTGAKQAETLVIANAGAYILPRTDRPYPEGLGGVAVAADLRTEMFRRHVVLLLGEADTDPHHTTLPRQPWAMAQGTHRFARGWFFFDTMRLAAEAQGALFTWRVATVPGVGHSNGGMSQYAAQHLFASAP